jgi:uncharacterized protein (DUF2141 family)
MKTFLFCLNIWLLTAISPAFAVELNVSIEGIKSNAGVVVIRVYQGKDEWLEDKGFVAMEQISLADWTESSTVSTTMDIPAGEYAISAYQDEDDDGKLDSNFVGIPKEPAGMSNKPKARMGPPRYEDAAFELPEAGLSIAVELN